MAARLSDCLQDREASARTVTTPHVGHSLAGQAVVIAAGLVVVVVAFQTSRQPFKNVVYLIGRIQTFHNSFDRLVVLARTFNQRDLTHPVGRRIHDQ